MMAQIAHVVVMSSPIKGEYVVTCSCGWRHTGLRDKRMAFSLVQRHMGSA